MSRSSELPIFINRVKKLYINHKREMSPKRVHYNVPPYYQNWEQQKKNHDNQLSSVVEVGVDECVIALSPKPTNRINLWFGIIEHLRELKHKSIKQYEPK
jgi:hypothetical protein